MKAGRPTKYKAEFAKQAAKLCKLGATNADLANFFEVGTTTIDRWIAERPGFRGALKAGKNEADDRVERSLYQKAVGYEYDAVKIFMPAGATEPVYATYREKLPPSDTACIYWLKNRRSDKWRDSNGQAISFKVPDMTTATDATKAMGEVIRAVSKGELTPAQGSAVAGLVETFRRTLETEELERRVERIEERNGR